MLMPRSLISSSRSFGHDDEGVDLVLQRVDAALGLGLTALALEAERLGDDADGQRADRLGDARDDGRAARSGSAALPRGDEDHVGTRERLFDLLGVVLGGTTADLGIGSCAESAGELAAHIELDVGVAEQQGLSVGVDGDELDAAQSELDHAVDRIHAAAADADDLDHGQVVLVVRHCGLRCMHLNGAITLKFESRVIVMPGMHFPHR